MHTKFGRSGIARTLIAGAAVFAFPIAGAVAQPAQPKPKPQPKPAPTVPAVDTSESAAAPAAKRPDPKIGPYLELSDTRNWVLQVNVRLNSDSSDVLPGQHAPGENAPERRDIHPFDLSHVAIVFPAVEETAASRCRVRAISGSLSFGHDELCNEPVLMEGMYHSGVKLVRFEGGDSAHQKPRVIELALEIPVACSKTKLDDEGAMKLDWPKGPWPQVAASTFQHQMFVDVGLDDKGATAEYDDKEITALIDRALARAKVKTPKELHPLKLAKVLARQICEEIQPSGMGQGHRLGTGELSGIDVRPALETLTKRKGSEHDITALAAWTFRKAGLPTRTVFGFDATSKLGDRSGIFSDPGGQKRVRSWVEFCLYDEDNNTINWIPVDIPAMRKAGSRPPSLDAPLRYFGTHDELRAVVPFAFHFHPPTDVIAYKVPGFWGWYVTPQAPANALQALSFQVKAAPTKVGPDANAKTADPKSKPDPKAKKKKDKDKD